MPPPPFPFFPSRAPTAALEDQEIKSLIEGHQDRSVSPFLLPLVCPAVQNAGWATGKATLSFPSFNFLVDGGYAREEKVSGRPQEGGEYRGLVRLFFFSFFPFPSLLPRVARIIKGEQQESTILAGTVGRKGSLFPLPLFCLYYCFSEIDEPGKSALGDGP